MLRYQRIGADSISLDEMWHLGLSTGRGSPQMVWPADTAIPVELSWTEITGAPPWWACWTNMERVLHPPLFVTTLRLWRDAFGSGDVAAQWYTAAWSLSAVVLLAMVVRTLTGSIVAGLWAAAILAVSPTQILLSQELRAYSMLTGLTSAAVLAAVRMEMHGVTTRRAIALGMCMLAMMLTHYFAIGPCVAIALWAGRRFRGQPLLTLLSSFTAAAVAFAIVWLPIALKQIPDIGHTADPWLKELAPHPYLLTIGRFFAMPIRLLVEDEYAGMIWPVIGFAFLSFAIWRATKQRNLLLPLLWFAGVCVFLLFLDFTRVTRHLVHIRYSLAAGPAVVAMIVIWAHQMKGNNSRRALGVHIIGAAAVLMLLALNHKAFFEDEPDYRVLREFMLDHVHNDEPMLFYSGPRVKGYFNEILMLAASREPTLWPRTIVKMSKPADPALTRSIDSETVWLFHGPVEDLTALLPGSTVLRSEILTDGKDRPVALCSQLKLR
jgi:hypothetical protein